MLRWGLGLEKGLEIGLEMGQELENGSTGYPFPHNSQPQHAERDAESLLPP